MASNKRSPHSILITSPNEVLHRHLDQLKKRNPSFAFEEPATNSNNVLPVTPAHEALEQLAELPTSPLLEQPQQLLRIRRMRDRLKLFLFLREGSV